MRPCRGCGGQKDREGRGIHYCTACAARAAEREGERRPPSRVPNEPFRVAFERSGERPSDIALRLGWMSGGRADTSRVLRRLGLVRNTSKGPEFQTTMNRATAEVMALAMGDPVDFGL